MGTIRNKSIIDMIEFLSSIKYGERALTELRMEHDRKLDEVCMYLNEQIERPPRIIADADCPGGVCGTGGRQDSI